MDLQQQRYLLPESFSPSEDDVVIGRGKKIVAHNAKFYKIVGKELEAYHNASSKALKSLILVRILQHVRDVVGAKFVKKDGDRWLEVEDSLARTTIAQAFRDSLSSHYRSSKQFKQRRRKQAKKVSPSRATSDTTMLSAIDCARMAFDQNRCGSPLLQDPDEGGDGLLHKLRDVFSLDIPFNGAEGRKVKSLHQILDEVQGMGLLDIPSQEQGESEVMESLDGAFSPSEVAAACDQDFVVSSSLFSENADASMLFEPTPLEAADEFGVLGELDLHSAFAI